MIFGIQRLFLKNLKLDFIDSDLDNSEKQKIEKALLLFFYYGCKIL